jgi:hypothetical protein
MRTFYKAVLTVALSAMMWCPLAYAQHGDRDDHGRRDRDERREERGPYGRARGLVWRVQRDLERAQKMAPVAGRQRERYENAQRHLSEFDDRLSQGDYDGGTLNTAIEDVKNVVRANVLSPRSRDELRDDLEALRSLRAARGRM